MTSFIDNTLLVETSPPTVNGGWVYAVEDYVWLAGAPIAVIRGSMQPSGSEWVRGAEGSTNSCQKLSDGAYCGRYEIVTDLQARPVLMIRQSTSEITQAATYDAFGHANRVAVVAGVDNNSPAFISQASLPHGNKWVRLRANYVNAPTNPVRPNSSTVFAASSTPRANVVSGYVNTLADSIATDIGGFSAASGGLQTTELEYYNTSMAFGLFTQLRFPGQYLDPETDLVENWNRYYDPSSGQYLSPEPLLQSPAYVRLMAQSGRSVPTYAYALNNPLKYVDPTGLGPEPNWSDANMVRTIDRMLKTPEGAALWKQAKARPESILLISQNAALAIDPQDAHYGQFTWGHTPRRKGSQACYVDTRPEWDGTDQDPAAVLAHEIEHALTNLTNYNMSATAREVKSQLRQLIIEMQLSR